ncbi:MAG TPA: LytTR family DNA-binding domain-containing protein [Chitinophagaceae bacterium]|nr:LytTR family DNA-binding domain-containing protein [Chitinophagaceae bacterium]
MLNTIIIENKKTDENEVRKSQQPQRIVPAHFGGNEMGYSRITYLPEKKKRTRLVVQKGIENISMPVEDIVLFYTENKIVYAIDQAGKKYMTEKNLSDLQEELDESVFFRANRQYIVNVKHIKSFKPYEKVKVKIDMRPQELNEQYYIIVSQEKAPAFRKWIYAA